ncbi:MAG: cellulase family glycosylhydrolase [Bacteroidales bacterium]|nr:cellulase family glycosylhydrolase [Bacteroidales bacterium]
MELNSRLRMLLFCVLTILAGNTAAQITPHEAVSRMKKGINLGNTLEPPDEGGWNNGPARERYFDLYKEAGFDVVRVPVRWDEHTGNSSPYMVDKSWMDRIEEILEWGLERDLFIVVNAHHEEWIKEDYSNAGKRARFDSIWSQIAVRFQDKSEKLIFEIINEPKGLTKEQNDELHQRILSIIRKTNPTRNVIIQGNNWGGAEELMTMVIPEDDYLIGSFHSYDPWPFGLEGHGPFGPIEINALKNKFSAVKTWAESNNIPVFLGEFGCHKDAEYNLRMLHYRTYVELIQQYGFTPCVWDDGGTFRVMERATSGWNEIKDILIHTTADAPGNPKLSNYQDTLIRLEWSNRLDDCDSIVIERKTHIGSFSMYATFPPDAGDLMDTNVFPNIYYYYRIIAFHNNGTGLYSQPVRILMTKYIPQVRGLFLGEPLPIPGIVEAEHFDTGGEGLAYHDTDDINRAGEYRPDEGVDIYNRLGEGFHIGDAMPGEWYEYTVAVEQEGEYLMDVHLAAMKSGGQFLVTIGESSSDTLFTLSSGSWLQTNQVSVPIYLSKGTQVMRFSVIDEPLFNFDKIEFTLNTTGMRNPGMVDGLRISKDPGGQLIITQDDTAEIRMIRIYSMSGTLIQIIDHPGHPARISTCGISTGLYIIQVHTQDHLKNIKTYIGS